MEFRRQTQNFEKTFSINPTLMMLKKSKFGELLLIAQLPFLNFHVFSGHYFNIHNE